MPVYKTLVLEQLRIAEFIALHSGDPEAAPKPGEAYEVAYGKILKMLERLRNERDNLTKTALTLHEEIGLLKKQITALEQRIADHEKQ